MLERLNRSARPVVENTVRVGEGVDSESRQPGLEVCNCVTLRSGPERKIFNRRLLAVRLTLTCGY